MTSNKQGESTSKPSLNTASLMGARIWLSGAIPESEGVTDTQRNAILTFVRLLARRVFQRGGHIVHGSHPTFTPTLLEEARQYQQQGGRKDCLTLAVSRYWSKDPRKAPLDEWRTVAMVYETPEDSGDHARDASLELLRKWMVSSSDAIVVVGGKWWQAVAGRAGVPLEIGLAVERGIPGFLLGGLGGAARDFVAQHPEVLTQLRNGFDLDTNRRISTTDEIADLAHDVVAQLERLPLVRGRGSDGASFRILALDGGGVKGAFTASALATWEEQTKLRIVEHFDLIAGTSTGGILAIGIGLGLSAHEILGFYKKRGPVIFPVMRFHTRAWRHAIHLFRPKYSQTVLLSELESALYRGKPPIPLIDSHCRLVIPAYHALAGESHIIRTPHHPDLTADAKTQAAQVALATAAAPTFFVAARIANSIAEARYFDGGVWANSPVMAAIIEAVCYLRIPPERIDVLSVGTTEEPFTVPTHASAGIIGWLWKRRILDLLMNVQQESSLKLAQNLLGSPRFIRVNTITAPGTFSLDGANEIEALADLGNRSALHPDTLREIKSRFLNGVCATRWESFGPP